MSRRVRGVALIVVNPLRHILVLQELETKEHLGKLSGMYSIPMETAEPGEHISVTLQRLVRQELPGFEERLQIHPARLGWYRITRQVWVSLYGATTTSADLPLGNGEVGNHAWMSPRETLNLWLRQGAREMLIDYLHRRSGVVCMRCQPPPSAPVRSSAHVEIKRLAE